MMKFIALLFALVFADYKGDQEAWLRNNKGEMGVTTTGSGLQYKVFKEGDGKHFPKATDKVKVHYVGTLTDGSEFDSSVKRDRPAEFRLNGVIKGWTEGVQLQSIGSKFRFYIPAELGYGSRGAGAKIPGDSALMFDVELLAINGNAYKEEL